MAYPKRLLNEGEHVILDLRQHWISLTAAILWTLAILAGLVVLLWLLWSTETWVKLLLGGAALVAFFLLAGWRYATWLRTYFVLTTERVVSRSGVIAKRAMDIPLDRINDIHFTQTIFERVFGSGNLVISSASEMGNNTFRFIRDPERVQNEIYRAREDDERRGRLEMARSIGQPPAPSGQGTPAEPVPERIRHLARLREEGLITPEEFEAKKAELLDLM